MILSIVAYVASAWCIVTYLMLARGKPAFHNFVANAVGGPFICVVTTLAHAWPALVLNVFFTLAGWVGMITERRKHLRQRRASAEKWARDETYLQFLMCGMRPAEARAAAGF